MRNVVAAILLCVLLQACGSKGALYLPPEKSDARQSETNKQK